MYHHLYTQTQPHAYTGTGTHVCITTAYTDTTTRIHRHRHSCRHRHNTGMDRFEHVLLIVCYYYCSVSLQLLYFLLFFLILNGFSYR